MPDDAVSLECWALTMNGHAVPNSDIAANFSTLAGDPLMGCPKDNVSCDLVLSRTDRPLNRLRINHVMLLQCRSCGEIRYVSIMTAQAVMRRAAAYGNPKARQGESP